MVEICYIDISNTVTTGRTWLLSIDNVASMAEESNFKFSTILIKWNLNNMWVAYWTVQY
jgi:hypothetical protein